MGVLDYRAFVRQLRICEVDTEDGRQLTRVMLAMAAEEIESLMERNSFQAREIASLQRDRELVVKDISVSVKHNEKMKYLQEIDRQKDRIHRLKDKVKRIGAERRALLEKYESGEKDEN